MRREWIIPAAQFENSPYRQHLILPSCSFIHISATVPFADSCRQIQLCHQHPKVQSQPAGRRHQHPLRWHQLPQRRGRVLETRPSILLKYQHAMISVTMCVNVYCRVFFLFRQIRGLLMLTRQWQKLEKPTRGLRIWTQRFETFSRKSKVKGNLNSAAQMFGLLVS